MARVTFPLSSKKGKKGAFISKNANWRNWRIVQSVLCTCWSFKNSNFEKETSNWGLSVVVIIFYIKLGDVYEGVCIIYLTKSLRSSPIEQPEWSVMICINFRHVIPIVIIRISLETRKHSNALIRQGYVVHFILAWSQLPRAKTKRMCHAFEYCPSDGRWIATLRCLKDQLTS